jgi:hypothetical protein
MLFVECKPDYALVALLSPRKVEHAGNKVGVIKKLVRSPGVPNFENSMGMVDEDPLSTRDPDLRHFTELARSNRAKIKVLHYRLLNNRLIVLCPRLEEWIIAAAREAQVRLTDYNLPDNPTALHEIINLRTDNFEDLIKTLRGRSSRVGELQRLLKESANRRSTRQSPK